MRYVHGILLSTRRVIVIVRLLNNAVLKYNVTSNYYLHVLSKSSIYNIVFIAHFRRYKLVLNKCGRQAKLKFNERLIRNSNKTKTTWEVVKRETGKFLQYPKI